MPGPAISPQMPSKEAWWGQRKRDLLHGSGHAVGRSRESPQLIFSHLWGTDKSCGLNRHKNRGQGTKVCIIKQSQSQVCSGWPLSQSKGSQRGFGEDVMAVITWGKQSGSCEMTASAPQCSLIITDSCPHLEGCLSCTCHCSLWEVSVSCHKDVYVLSFLESKVLQSDCKENGL
jgi:hypothetical protein